MSDGLHILAHRGASADHPENTLEAFAAAAVQGADWVELDVRPTAEGVLIVHHDPWYRPERPGGSRSAVWSTPAVRRPSGVPTLPEALDTCLSSLTRSPVPRPLGVNVEMKNSPGDLGGGDVAHTLEVADAVVELLRSRAAAGTDDEVLLSSFDGPTLDRVRELDGPPTGLLVVSLAEMPSAPEAAVDRGHVAFHPADWDVDAALVERCHGLGLAVNVWTVDDPVRMVELATLGVDGIVTNVPAVAARALRRDH